MDATGRTAGEGAHHGRARREGGRRRRTGPRASPTPRLWQGVRDPYLYTLRVEVLDARGAVVDRVSQRFGIRQMASTPTAASRSTASRVPLHGVAMHQDYLGKGWAIADRDTDASLALVKEIGANTLRLAHYPHAQHTLQRADEMGLVVWAEVPFVNGVRLSCSNEQATERVLGERRAAASRADPPAVQPRVHRHVVHRQREHDDAGTLRRSRTT